MSINIPNALQAFGSVNGTTGLAVAGAGFVAAGGAGVYTITLDQAVDATECAILVTGRGPAAAADGTFTVTQTSDTVKTVNYTEAGVAAAADFDFLVLRCPQGA